MRAGVGEQAHVVDHVRLVRGVALRGAYDAVREGYHLNKRHWVTLTLGRDLPDDLVVGLIETSYELVTMRPRARR